MSINDDINKTLQDGNGTQTTFEFSFKIFKDTDLEVYKVDKETGDAGDILTLNTDYTVSINKVGEGGTVTFTEAPTEDEQVGIYRSIEIIQPANIPTDTEYVEKTMENALDRACMIDQQLQEQIDRCIQIPAFSNGVNEDGGSYSFDGVSVELPVPAAENVLAWNSDATALENYDLKGEIAEFEETVTTEITNAKSDFQSQMDAFTADIGNVMSVFQDETETKVDDFISSVTEQIETVTEAAEKINELSEAVQEAKDSANTAIEKAEEVDTVLAEAKAEIAETVASVEATAQEMSDKFADIEEFRNSFPAVVNLTTWATLNDGQIYNIPFDDVKADTNRFIQYKDTDGRRTIEIKANTFIRLETETDVRHLTIWEDTTIAVEDYLDDGTELTNGKDYSIFLVPEGDEGIAIKISLNKTAPEGYDTYNTRRIGGFHTECADVGTVQDDNDMNGWLAGDIIPNSVWTLWHKPAVASPSGALYIPERDAWCTIYTQSGTLENTVFEYKGTTTRSRTVWDHEADLALVGWDFPTSLDFTISNLGVVPLKAVYGKAESSCTTAGGWKNENNVRMVASSGIESTAGGLWNFLQERGPYGGSSWASGGSNTLTSPKQYGSINRLIGGGAWDDSGYAGPSSRNGNSSATSTSTHYTARGWSRPLRARQ